MTYLSITVSVKEIWETIIRLYSKLEDESRMAELNRKSIELRQEQRGVLEYSNELTAIWNEIDFYRPLPTDPTGREYILKGRTYAFLTGLRPEFETIRSLLLNRERSASFDESVIHVIKQESRLQAMQAANRQESQIFLTKSATITPIPNTSTNGQGQSNKTGTIQMPPKQSYNQAKKGYQRKKGDAKDNLWCDFCQRYRHKRETCWKIHGRPMISQSHMVSHGGNWQQHHGGNWQ